MFIKKLVLIAAGAAGAVALINGVSRGLPHTAWKKVQAGIERTVSPEMELDRIRDQIAQLTPDMHENISRVAREMVAVESLGKQVDAARASLDQQKASLMAMTDALEKGDLTRVHMTAPEVKRQLDRQLKSYKNCERELQTKQKILEAKRQALETARQQLIEIREQKAKLEAVVADYETELATLRLEQARSKVQVDDSRLGDIKGSLEKLREKIQEERAKIQLTGEFLPSTLNPAEPQDKATTEDVVNKVRAAIGEPSSKGSQEVKVD